MRGPSVGRGVCVCAGGRRNPAVGGRGCVCLSGGWCEGTRVWARSV